MRLMNETLKNSKEVTVSVDTLRTLIDDAVRAGRKVERLDTKKARNPNYSITEDKLYKYPMLILKVEQDELDIQDLEKEKNQIGCTQKSKDIVYIPNGGIRLDPIERQEALIADKKLSKNRTLKEIEKMDKALEKVKNYKGYEIIGLKYFQRVEPDDAKTEL
jgi:hypothetical protein